MLTNHISVIFTSSFFPSRGHRCRQRRLVFVGHLLTRVGTVTWGEARATGAGQQRTNGGPGKPKRCSPAGRMGGPDDDNDLPQMANAFRLERGSVARESCAEWLGWLGAKALSCTAQLDWAATRTSQSLDDRLLNEEGTNARFCAQVLAKKHDDNKDKKNSLWERHTVQTQ